MLVFFRRRREDVPLASQGYSFFEQRTSAVRTSLQGAKLKEKRKPEGKPDNVAPKRLRSPPRLATSTKHVEDDLDVPQEEKRHPDSTMQPPCSSGVSDSEPSRAFAPTPSGHPNPFSFASSSSTSPDDLLASLLLAQRRRSSGPLPGSSYGPAPVLEPPGRATGMMAGRIASSAVEENGRAGFDFLPVLQAQCTSDTPLHTLGTAQAVPPRPQPSIPPLPALTYPAFATTSHHFQPTTFPLSLTPMASTADSLSASGSGDSSSFDFASSQGGFDSFSPPAVGYGGPALAGPSALQSSSESSAGSAWSIQGGGAVLQPFPPSKASSGWEYSIAPPSLPEDSMSFSSLHHAHRPSPAWPPPTLRAQMSSPYQTVAQPQQAYDRSNDITLPPWASSACFPPPSQPSLAQPAPAHSRYQSSATSTYPMYGLSGGSSLSVGSLAASFPPAAPPPPSSALDFLLRPRSPLLHAPPHPAYAQYPMLPVTLPPPAQQTTTSAFPQPEKAKRPSLSKALPPARIPRGDAVPKRAAKVKAIEALGSVNEGAGILGEEMSDSESEGESPMEEDEPVATPPAKTIATMMLKQKKPSASQARTTATHVRTASTTSSLFSLDEEREKGYSTAPTSPATSPVAPFVTIPSAATSSGKKPPAPKGRTAGSSDGRAGRPKLNRSVATKRAEGGALERNEGVWESEEEFWGAWRGKKGGGLRMEDGKSVDVDFEITTPSSFTYDTALSSWRTYRRNFLSLTVNLTVPTDLSSLRLASSTKPIKRFEVEITSTTHPQGAPVELLQFDANRNLKQAKTLGRQVLQPVPLAPSMSEDGARKGTASRPLASSSPSSSASSTLSTTFNRVQFRSSTSNHPSKTLRASTPDARFVMQCRVFAVLEGDEDTEVEIGSWDSALLQVRGRSPGSFGESRKGKKDGTGAGQGATAKGKAKKRKTSPTTRGEVEDDDGDEEDQLDSDYGDDDDEYTPASPARSTRRTRSGGTKKRRRSKTPSSPLAEQ
ncbi:hypothetical protein JCM11251_006818 [Rhodosporidiobolus azoricus]